jgi:AcrR family transcriptional regulator
VGAPVLERTLRRDAAINRQRLLDAASQVFAERGLDASVEEVARAAGVGMGTLYRRFATKEALISALVRELLIDVAQIGRECLEEPDGAGLEQFLFRAGAAVAGHRGCVARWWTDDESRAIKAECRMTTKELLVDAQAHGRIRSDAQPADIDLVFWSLRGVIEATQGIADTAWRRQIAVMVAGLRPSPESLAEPALTEAEAESVRRAATAR